MGDSDVLTKVSTKNVDMFDRVLKAIQTVGFPVVIAVAMIAYMWFIGRATNDHLARGAEIMNRAVAVIERLERKIP